MLILPRMLVGKKLWKKSPECDCIPDCLWLFIEFSRTFTNSITLDKSNMLPPGRFIELLPVMTAPLKFYSSKFKLYLGRSVRDEKWSLGANLVDLMSII